MYDSKCFERYSYIHTIIRVSLCIRIIDSERMTVKHLFQFLLCLSFNIANYLHALCSNFRSKYTYMGECIIQCQKFVYTVVTVICWMHAYTLPIGCMVAVPFTTCSYVDPTILYWNVFRSEG